MRTLRHIFNPICLDRRSTLNNMEPLRLSYGYGRDSFAYDKKSGYGNNLWQYRLIDVWAMERLHIRFILLAYLFNPSVYKN